MENKERSETRQKRVIEKKERDGAEENETRIKDNQQKTTIRNEPLRGSSAGAPRITKPDAAFCVRIIFTPDRFATGTNPETFPC